MHDTSYGTFDLYCRSPQLVHIFEMRDGKIARELVYDMGRVA